MVVTKTDYIADLERDYDYKEEHFDFIQQSIRHFCLQFGGKKCQNLQEIKLILVDIYETGI